MQVPVTAWASRASLGRLSCIRFASTGQYRPAFIITSGSHIQEKCTLNNAFQLIQFTSKGAIAIYCAGHAGHIVWYRKTAAAYIFKSGSYADKALYQCFESWRSSSQQHHTIRTDYHVELMVQNTVQFHDRFKFFNSNKQYLDNRFKLVDFKETINDL